MKPSVRKTTGVFVIVVLALLVTSSISFADNTPRIYEVTITNLTSHQAFTPPVVATHRKMQRVFEVGKPASFEVKEIAENGNLTPMVDALNANKKVYAVQVAASNPPPLMPGQSIIIQIGAKGANFLSMVAMLICTNDGFTGVDSLRLPLDTRDVVTLDLNGYDAGTEINTEDFADIVPPCPALSGAPSNDPGSGVSNPALAENSVITHHPNVQGGNDLQPAIHGWSDPVARVTVRRLS
jgi:hypothetical protein